MPLRDYFVIFTPPQFYDDGKTDCSTAFDGDVAGRGIVSSLVATAILTTMLAICAPFLDGIAGHCPGKDPEGCRGVFPRRVNERLFRSFGEVGRERSVFLRKVLTRVMITLADQQILTGIAIIISGYVRAAQLDSRYVAELPSWRYRLIENHFFLVVYLACLSSSSHLAAIVALKRYLIENKFLAFFRLAFIVLFAILLTVTICLAVPFGPPTLLVVSIDSNIQAQESLCAIWQNSYGNCTDVRAYKFLLALFYIVAIVLILYPYWIAIVNTFETWNRELERHFHTIWRSDSKWLPMHWIRLLFRALDALGPARFWKALRKALKQAALFVVLGSSGAAFCLQILFFSVSLFYVLLQRMSNKPPNHQHVCDLSAGGTVWGFGQILPMILLANPVISAIVAFFEVRNDMLDEKSVRSPQNKEAPSPTRLA